MRKRRLKREHGRRRNPQSVRNEADASALAQSPRLVGEDTRGADRPWRSRGSEWGGLQQSRYVLSFGHSLARDCVLGFSLIRLGWGNDHCSSRGNRWSRIGQGRK